MKTEIKAFQGKQVTNRINPATMKEIGPVVLETLHTVVETTSGVWELNTGVNSTYFWKRLSNSNIEQFREEGDLYMFMLYDRMAIRSLPREARCWIKKYAWMLNDPLAWMQIDDDTIINI